MIVQAAVWLAALGYAAVDVAVVMAPSLVLALAANKGGLEDSHGIDLVVASAAVGVPHAAVAFRRLVAERRSAKAALDVWVAAVDALAVLGVGSTLLLIVVLGGFADAHAVLVNRGWSVVWLWLGVQLIAVGLAELTARLTFRWLERGADLNGA